MKSRYASVCALTQAALFGLASLSVAQSPDEGTAQSGQATSGKSPAEKVRENSYLREKIEPLLPQGMDPVTAAEGYTKLDHFVASAQLTKNLDIPFEQFKSQFLGSTGGSLEKTVHALKPSLPHEKVTQEVAKAESQAREHIQAAEREQQAASDTGQEKRPMAGRP